MWQLCHLRHHLDTGHEGAVSRCRWISRSIRPVAGGSRWIENIRRREPAMTDPTDPNASNVVADRLLRQRHPRTGVVGLLGRKIRAEGHRQT